MRQEQEEGGLNPAKDYRQGVNLLYLVSAAWAITIYLPLRYGSGKEHAGLRGVLGLLFPCVFMLFVPDPSVAWIWPVYLGGLMIQRFGHWRAYRRGELVQTRYQGYPWVASLLCRQHDESKAKTFTEPFLAVAIGVALCPFAEGLAVYYLFGSVAMFIKQFIENLSFQRQVDQLQDAMIENDYLMSQTRALRRFA
jgi:hypothetical protein